MTTKWIKYLALPVAMLIVGIFMILSSQQHKANDTVSVDAQYVEEQNFKENTKENKRLISPGTSTKAVGFSEADVNSKN